MEFHQILYKEEQRKHLYPFAIPYWNETLTIFFENDPISKIVSETKTDRLAVCSWKLFKKVRNIHPVTKEKLLGEYEVLSLTRNSDRHKMMAMSNAWHPGFLPTITMLWNKLGFKMPGEVRNPIYQNHYSCRTDLYKEYVNSFLIPAMKLTIEDPEMNKLMMQDSGYARLSREADIKSVRAKLGLNEFPMAPFILERCPSLWMTMKKIRVSYL